MEKLNIRVDTIGSWTLKPVRNENTATNREDVEVQVVVDQVELLSWCKGTGGTVDGARECAVGRVVLIFPHLASRSA